MAKIQNAREYGLAIRRQQEILNSTAGKNFSLSEAEATEMASIDDSIRSYLSTPASGPVFTGGSAAGTSGEVRVLPPTQEQKRHDVHVALASNVIALTDSARRTPADIALEFGNERVASAAMQANTHGRGGSWIHGAISETFVEMLRPESIVRMMGCAELPLEDGTLDMPKENGGPTGAYLGEDEDADVETISTGDVKLVAKELVCIVPASDKLLRSRSAKAAERIGQSLLRGAGQTEDLYFLRGTPAGAGPTGMRYLAAASNILTANATLNLSTVTNDLSRLELALMANNVRMRKACWLMHPRSLIYLAAIQNGNGLHAFPELSTGDTPMLRRKPVYVSTQIPANLGSGDKTEIMLADAEHLVIGDAPRISLDASNTAAYNDGGTLKAAFSGRKTLTRLVMENDFNTLHDGAIAVLTDVGWLP